MAKLSKKADSLRESLSSITEHPLSGIDVIFGGQPKETQGAPLPTFAPDIELQAKLAKERRSGRGRPRKGEPEKQRQRELYEVVCLKISRSTMGKIRTIAYRDSKKLQDVVNSYLLKSIEEYESTHGEITEVVAKNDTNDIKKLSKQ